MSRKASRRGRSHDQQAETPPVLVHIVELSHLAAPNSYAFEVYRLLGLMLFPDGGTALSSFVVSASYDRLVEYAAQMQLPGFVRISGKPRDIEIRPVEKFVAETLIPLLHYKGANEEPDLHGLYSGISIAGTILRRSFKMAAEGFAELGILAVLAEQGEAYRAEGLIGAGRDNLAQVWAKYRSVSHIGAAFVSIKKRSPQDRRVLLKWIGRAEDIRKEAMQIGSRFAEPILPPDQCWRIVITPTAFGRGVPENFRNSDSVTSKPPWSQ